MVGHPSPPLWGRCRRMATEVVFSFKTNPLPVHFALRGPLVRAPQDEVERQALPLHRQPMIETR